MAERNSDASSAEAPWMRQKAWASGRINSTGIGPIVGLWIFAFVWNGIICALGILFWDDPEKRNALKVLSLFSLVGLGLLFWALRRTWTRIRYGGSVLELSSIPGVIGGTLEGKLLTNLQTMPAGPIQLNLTCTRRYLDRKVAREDSEIKKTVLWQTDSTIEMNQCLRGVRGIAIPFRIFIPYGLPECDDFDVNNQTFWHLVARCEMPGPDFHAEFAVPVFVTAKSDSTWTEEKVYEMAAQKRRPSTPQEVSPDGRQAQPISGRPTPKGGMAYDFRPNVPRKKAIGVTLAGLLITGGAIALYYWLGEFGPFALLPGILGLLFLLAAMIIIAFKASVVIEGGEVIVRKSLLGIPITRKIPFSEIRQIQIRREMVEGLKEKDRDWDIEIDRDPGEAVKLGTAIREHAEAVRLVNEIRALIR
jgi:hypothetical protein